MFGRERRFGERRFLIEEGRVEGEDSALIRSPYNQFIIISYFSFITSDA